ncbi:MAG: histone deacetylase [Planctomycetes bacterium]|nr:histone deacetylase [Planctomycetota bacterium]
MPATGFVSPPLCRDHDPGRGHPERAERLVHLGEHLASVGLLAEVENGASRAATPLELARVHSAGHIERVRSACLSAPLALDGDTAVSKSSYAAAQHAAGGVLTAVERVLRGDWHNAFCAVRPPGHHAEQDAAMGFCLFNNVAVAAAALRHEHGLARVAILDWDVHHGNGTQHLFERDPSVFYASLHQWPLYPGTGAAEERGLGAGEGATRNCPLPSGSGDAQWLRALEDTLLPELEAFRPEFVLLSAGFDAHRLDPLSGTCLSAAGYAQMTRRMLELAARSAHGRLVSVLEGGYHLEALASCVETHLGELVTWSAS